MSGISSITSGSSSALPNGGLSSVGASLLTSGSAPNPAPAAASTSPASTPTSPAGASTSPAGASTSPAGALSTYQAQYLNLQQYDTQELLYASFLTPSESLANADSVLEQAATLLGSPGHPGTLATSATSTAPPPSSASSALTNLPSVASILAASDSEAQQTLNAYANAPVGSSVLDYQA